MSLIEPSIGIQFGEVGHVWQVPPYSDGSWSESIYSNSVVAVSGPFLMINIFLCVTGSSQGFTILQRIGKIFGGLTANICPRRSG